MEKSRAIELLEHLAWDRDIDKNPYGDALNVAIEALETQLSKEGTTFDTISRQAALDIFDDYNVSVENGELEAYSRDRKRLCELPTIQPVATDTNVGDTISRQQAIDVLSLGKEMLSRVLDDIDVVGTVREKYSWGLGLIESYINDINELPSAQPEPQEGQWVYGEDSMADCVDGYRCSQCGFFVPWDYNHKLIDYINDYAYCPNCGARMKGEQDGH